MWNWLTEHSDPLNVLLSALMLVVWALYFQLLLSGYRRSRRCKILINRANGHSLATRCAVTNMSTEAIYIEGVIAELQGKTPEERIICSLTDHGGRVDPTRVSDEDGYQGPLGSGEAVELGSYRQIIKHAQEQGDGHISVLRRLRLTVVATYGPEDRPVAAERDYDIVERNGKRVLLSEMVVTRQVRSAFERRQIEQLMREQAAARTVGGE
ncbi:hypothetical protein [Chelativorans sp. Marseille-P2723]|uniref:hypothetical protein n=1 Tax=Chelativorans sp. Marseille-P2723 TaxID=2709133 RepID=UPI00156DC5BA|nr:hypothetical protein [Chelativorans sp. Marseille-P2723]